MYENLYFESMPGFAISNYINNVYLNSLMKTIQSISILPIMLTIGSLFLSGLVLFNLVEAQPISSNLTASNSTDSGVNINSTNQTSQGNQTANSNSNTPQIIDQLLTEKLLNYTNNAIIALSDDNESEIQRNLVQIQNELIEAIDRPVVIVPAPALITDSD
jgi:hypothetical protein